METEPVEVKKLPKDKFSPFDGSGSQPNLTSPPQEKPAVKKLSRNKVSVFEGNAGQTAVRKFYIFDRDDTLIDQHNALIHPEFIVPFVQMIEREEDFQWAIASSGAVELREDPGYQALSLAMRGVTKDPIYVQFNRQATLIASVVSMDNFDISWDEKEIDLPPEKQAQIVLDILIKVQLDNLFDGNYLNEAVKSERSETTVTFNKNSSIQFKFGNTLLSINVNVFLNNLADIAKGDYKLFFVLAALDSAKIKPTLTKQLKALGILEIAAPADYVEIIPKDVVFTDDKESNCDVIRGAGFTAILADTPADTYLQKLSETIPPDVQFRNLSTEITSANLNSLSAEKIELLRNNVLTLLKDNLDLPGVKLSELVPLFDYSRFYLLKPSIKPVTSNAQIIALADQYVAKNVYDKEIADFLVLRLCKDWKRAEIQTKVAAIANIKPEGQITVSPTHFRMAYVAQYQSEFFKNPRSKMLRKIEQDPAAFDNTDINAIVSEENGRSKEVLTKLGQRA